MSTQLYAKIKRTSEYHGQHKGEDPFPVEFAESGHPGSHIVLSDSDRYRIEDLRFYVRVGERFVVLS